ncbi:MAG: transcriptional repressor NrdR [Clostridia bacterium]|nr:transcriptional repressor NrdR [Clostridia bacterium]
MIAPNCGHPDSKVLDSRPTEEGNAIRRRRECLGCGDRFTTYERAEVQPLFVVKRDGRREPFDAEKVLRGLLLACKKRPVPVEALEALAARVEREVRARGEREVPSQVVGELVMEGLQGLDEVAYVRFASVYRAFGDLERFREELERLMRRDAGTGVRDVGGGKEGQRGAAGDPTRRVPGPLRP